MINPNRLQRIGEGVIPHAEKVHSFLWSLVR
jgi:hypothetical protein